MGQSRCWGIAPTGLGGAHTKLALWLPLRLITSAEPPAVSCHEPHHFYIAIDHSGTHILSAKLAYPMVASYRAKLSLVASVVRGTAAHRSI